MSLGIFKTGGRLIRLFRDGLSLNDKVYIESGTTDPTIVAVDAPKGSLYLMLGTSGGKIFIKSDDGLSTNYKPLMRVVGAVASEVRVDTGAGHGSVNTKIRRFTNVRATTGSAVTYSASSTLGDSFTIVEPAIYAMSYTDGSPNLGISIGITKNSLQLTTSVFDATILPASLLGLAFGPSGTYLQVSAIDMLAPGDVIRAHTDGNPNTTSSLCRFRIAKVGD